MEPISVFTDYWDFANHVKRGLRFFRTPEIDSFLSFVSSSSSTHLRTVPSGTHFYRAQLGHSWRGGGKPDHPFDCECPHPRSRMKPLPNSATEGRANPKGIPCLYLATDCKTAMSEIRPWIGKKISLAKFQTVRDLRIVACNQAATQGVPLIVGEISKEKREELLWAEIGKAFSEPISPDDSTADYAPTQLLCEYFKTLGLDGVAYKSRLGEGDNLALFDLDSAEVIETSLHKASGVSFDFSETDEPISIPPKKVKPEANQ